MGNGNYYYMIKSIIYNNKYLIQKMNQGSFLKPASQKHELTSKDQDGPDESENFGGLGFGFVACQCEEDELDSVSRGKEPQPLVDDDQTSAMQKATTQSDQRESSEKQQPIQECTVFLYCFWPEAQIGAPKSSLKLVNRDFIEKLGGDIYANGHGNSDEET